MPILEWPDAVAVDILLASSFAKRQNNWLIDAADAPAQGYFITPSASAPAAAGQRVHARRLLERLLEPRLILANAGDLRTREVPP